MDQHVDVIVRFLDRIGIRCESGEIAGETFLPGIKIEGGAVCYDPLKLTYPGDLLHEAGHIAVTPEADRGGLNQEVLGSVDPKESDEVAVLLWTYLAAKEMGLPVEVVFHAGGYKDGSQWLIEQFEGGNYIGLPLLTWMGITENPTSGEVPRVVRWLRG
jgi:hypothetical protein